MSAVISVFQRFRSYLQYRDDLVQLLRMTDRDLTDLGLNRYDILRMARSRS